MKFVVVPYGKYAPTNVSNTACLRVDRWNDHSYVTMFYLTIYDEDGNKHEIGDIKIGFKGQEITTHTHSTLECI